MTIYSDLDGCYSTPLALGNITVSCCLVHTLRAEQREIVDEIVPVLGISDLIILPSTSREMYPLSSYMYCSQLTEVFCRKSQDNENFFSRKDSTSLQDLLATKPRPSVKLFESFLVVGASPEVS